MKYILFAILAILFAACASKSAKPAAKSDPLGSINSAKCGDNEFQGSGTGKSDEEALNAARSSLAAQIHSSVRVLETSRRSQQVLDGEESISSKYESEFVMESALQNAHDASVLRVERSNGETQMVVCMSRANAAKGFIERQRLIADSLGIVSGVVIGTEHPKRKNEAWRKTQALIIESMRIQNLIEGWQASKPGLFDYANETYGKTKDYYANYCKSQKLYWEDSESECSNAVFAGLSKNAKIEKSECLNGLKLNFSCSEKCKSSSFGVECSFEPSLSIGSCGGEFYSLLKAREPAKGSDIHSENKARSKLIENLPNAAFFSEWEKEIKEWSPKCD